MSSEFNRNIDLIICSAGIVLCTFSLIQAAGNRYIEKETKNFFIVFFSIIDVYVLCLMVRELSHGCTGHGWAVLSRTVFFGQAILSSVLAVLVTALLIYQSGEKNWQKSMAFRISAGLWAIYAVMEISNLFTGMLYSVDENNAYTRGPLFALQMLPPVLIMLLNLIALILRRDRLTDRQRHAFAIYIAVPTVCMLMQTKLYGIHLIALGTVIAAMFMFKYLADDQMDRYRIQAEENEQLKVDLLMAQIRPHFLFNSLTAIKYLIGSDPEKADEALTSFMKYLRHNIDALLTDRMNTFSEELEYIKEYLELQKLRFGDELNVEYDLRCTDFMMPTLTLLPLVENAVSYGIRRNADRHGTVTIRSRRYPDRIEICVEDDGPGFVPDALPDDKERSHIGMANVRERIARVAGGELRIDSEEGKGTKATIILPQEVRQ